MRTSSRLLTLAMSLCLLAGAVVPQVAFSEMLEGTIEYTSQAYTLGAGDVLNLSVIPQLEYGAQNILVRSDGKASFPGVGDIYVSGMTMEELDKELASRLIKWLKKPQVVVSLGAPRSITIYLAGAVMKPGNIQMATSSQDKNIRIESDAPISRLNSTLTNVIANAGGVALNADLSQVQVKHASSGKVETVNLWNVLRDGSAGDDLWLNNNDSIVVPKLPDEVAMSDDDYTLLLRSTIAPKSFPVRIVGEVKTPDIIPMESNTPFLNSAISKAGGYTPNAVRHVVAIRRFTTDNKFTTLYVDPNKTDFVMRPNDVVYVGENHAYKSGRFMQQAAMILSPFVAASQIAGSASQVFGFGGWANRFNSGGTR